ncbi:MAG: class I SAM-dependent methyltransferase [Parachlamydiales bacterium]|nr:class I SAM-dependent methyltransferase [Parachlamydiales bacterium]
MTDYSLLDTGNLKKLEKFGPFSMIRPASGCVWSASFDEKDVDFVFSRDEKNKWINQNKRPISWDISVNNIKLRIKLTDFGNIGFFPEHLFICKKIESFLKEEKKPFLNVLNLFAYTGLATLFLAKNKAKVTHVDASKPTVLWAKENVLINNLQNASIRWIVDDVLKFLKREIKRNSQYDGIILDPPSFGRGTKGEVFKIEDDIFDLLKMCKDLLSKNFKFFIFTCHTPGFTKLVMQNLINDVFENSKTFKISIDEMKIEAKKNGKDLPSGFYVILERS